MNKTFLRVAVSVILAMTAAMPLATSAQDKKCAVVLLHGKWDAPRTMDIFARRLEGKCAYKSLLMPWSTARAYDVPYPVALDEIKKEVKAFRDQGYKYVLIGGHSFGANAALAYMTVDADVDGLILMAPGHVPKAWYGSGLTKESVDKAKTLIDEGKGAETMSYVDTNQGARKSGRASAVSVYSYFDPDGLANMPGTATRFKKAVPVVYVVGTADPQYRFGQGFVFDKLPSHPLSKYVVVSADHVGTTDQSGPAVVAFIDSLP